MNNLISLSLCCFVLLTFACQRNTDQVRVYDLEELVLDTLFLDKNATTKELGYDFQYFQTAEGQQLLRTFVGYTFYEYSYPEGTLQRTQVYEQEGPDGIGSFVQGAFIEENVIWFLSNFDLIKADFNGKIIEKYKLPEGSDQRESPNYSTRMGANIFRSGTSLLIPDAPFVLNETNISYTDWILSLDPSSGSHSFLSFQFPSEYQNYLNDPNFGRYRTAYNEEKKEVLISLPASDSLIVLESEGRKNVFGGVDEPMDFLKGEVSTEGEWVVFNSDQNTSLYSGIFYAEKEEMYIRFAIVVKETEQNIEDGKIPLTKMVILNKDLEKTGEVISKFATGGFNTPDGFYLWIGYPNSEDQVAYVRLDFDQFSED